MGDGKDKAFKTTIIVLAGIIVALVMLMAFRGILANAATPWKTSTAYSSYSTSGATGTASPAASTSSPSGEVQEVTLSIKNWQYVVTPSTLKLGVPVRMTVDMNSVYGCARSVTIPAFGVRKYVTESDSVIEFTPTKTGTITMSCSMGMYFGAFQVSADGQPLAGEAATAPVAGNPVPGKGGSCGAGGGGCGCGGARPA